MTLTFRPFIYGCWTTQDCSYAVSARLQYGGSRYLAKYVSKDRVWPLGSFESREAAQAACQAHADRQQVAA